MKRLCSGTRRDPLLLLLLAAIGAPQVTGCGGASEARHGLPPNPLDGTGADSGNPIMGSSGGGTARDADRPTGEGVLGCTTPTPYPVASPPPDPLPDTGFFSCTNAGFIHRAAAEACPAPYDALAPNSDGCPGENYCNDLDGTRCLPGGTAGCPPDRCVTECRSDSDCNPNELCVCDGQINHCVSGNCHTDAECGEGFLCISTFDAIKGPTPFECQTPDDECTASCAAYDTTGPNGTPQHMLGTCTLTLRDDGTAHRACAYTSKPQPVCGRPFLVEGTALMAEAVRRADWAKPVHAAPHFESVTPELRGALAVSWRDAALMEHASIAAFARFSLELLALGAPADLVRDAAHAMADEQRHAELCFALAGAYAGVPLGPGALDVRSCLKDVSLASVLVTTFLEGCLGETIAAVEARERARQVRDAALEATLSRIAEDESRHAALAWRFVKWALAENATGLEDALFAALETERQRLVTSEPLPRGVSDELALAHGLLSPAERARLRREALDEIVAPCLAALCPPRASGVFHGAPSSDEDSAPRTRSGKV